MDMDTNTPHGYRDRYSLDHGHGHDISTDIGTDIDMHMDGQTQTSRNGMDIGLKTTNCYRAYPGALNVKFGGKNLEKKLFIL